MGTASKKATATSVDDSTSAIALTWRAAAWNAKGETTKAVEDLATAIALDPSAPDHVVYLGTAAGGVWKSTDGGLNWTPKSDHEISLAIGAIAIHASAPATIWAGTGEGNDISADAYFGYGPLLSTNGGDTWELKKDNLFAGTRINAIVLERAGAKMHVMVACTNGLIESTDSGDTWAQTPVAGKKTRVTSMVLMVSPTCMEPTTSAPELTAPKWL